MSVPPTIALLGATGALGREILSVLEERLPQLGRVDLYASPLSAGEELLVGHRVVAVKALPSGPLPEVDLAIVALPQPVAEEALPRVRARGVVILGAEGGGQLILPAVNGEAADPAAARLRCPTDAVVPLALALAPLHRAAGITRVTVTSLEPASGLGQRGMEALSAQILDLYRRGEVGGASDTDEEEEVESPFPDQLAFNALPEVGALGADGLSAGERALAQELPSLLGAAFPVIATSVRVPWFSSHAQAVTVELERPLGLADARALLAGTPGLEILDDPSIQPYPTPFGAIGRDEVFVGRLRAHPSIPSALSLWICADNLRRGGALTAAEACEWWLARHHTDALA